MVFHYSLIFSLVLLQCITQVDICFMVVFLILATYISKFGMEGGQGFLYKIFIFKLYASQLHACNDPI